jgi:hypothetical protein
MVIDNWGKQMDNDVKIPSVISYSPSQDGEQQWGKSLSPDAVTMINTKLELDVQDNKTDELELILAVLEGTSNLSFQHVRASKGYPEYTWKNPEEIVTDYLTKVFQYLDKRVDRFSPELRAQLPVDIVLTVPVVSLITSLRRKLLIIFALELVIPGEELDFESSQSGWIQ